MGAWTSKCPVLWALDATLPVYSGTRSHKNLRRDWPDGSAGNVIAMKSDVLSSIPRIYMVEGADFLQVVPTHMDIPRINKIQLY